MSVSKNKQGHWQYNFMYRGVRYHRNFKGASYDEVLGYEAVAKSELRKSGYDIAKDRHNYMLSEIIADFREYAYNNYTRPDEAVFVVNKFYKLIGNKPAEQITVNDFEHYRQYRKKDVKASSINREMNNIKRVFSLAKSNKKIKYNPCDEIKPLKIENPRKRFLTKEEELKLLEASPPVMRAIILIAIQTGMRESEIKNLRWADVFFKEKYLVVLNTKNGKARKLLITPQMEEELLKLPKLGKYVFMNPVTKKQYTDFISTYMRAVKRSGIAHISFHELRHTTASRLNELGVDLSTIQEYLDHADARTTQRYIHKPKENILDAVKRLAEY